MPVAATAFCAGCLALPAGPAPALALPHSHAEQQRQRQLGVATHVAWLQLGQQQGRKWVARAVAGAPSTMGWLQRPAAGRRRAVGAGAGSRAISSLEHHPAAGCGEARDGWPAGLGCLAGSAAGVRASGDACGWPAALNACLCAVQRGCARHLPGGQHSAVELLAATGAVGLQGPSTSRPAPSGQGTGQAVSSCAQCSGVMQVKWAALLCPLGWQSASVR